MKKVILMQPLRYPHSRQQLRAEPDLEQVKADYLIHQIDQAFRLWTNSPWLEDLTLESFLEYLLPYRIGKMCIRDRPYKDNVSNDFRYQSTPPRSIVS